MLVMVAHEAASVASDRIGAIAATVVSLSWGKVLDQGHP